MKIGFIGLGAMGLPMAHHLARAGHAVTVWARRPEQAAASGLPTASTPADLAAQVEVVFTIVTRCEDVRAVTLGPQGLIEGFQPGSLQIDCSTIAPDTARAVARALNERGIGFLDAPVSGGAQGAQDATLAFMVGGSEADVARARPLLARLGQRCVHIGPQGAGQVAKACNQMIMVNAIQAIAEAMHLAGRSGLDLNKVQAALAGGSAASRVLEVMGTRMAQRNFTAGIEARLHHKDFGILMQTARQQGVPLPLSALVCQQLNALMHQGWGKEDTASLLRVLESTCPP